MPPVPFTDFCGIDTMGVFRSNPRCATKMSNARFTAGQTASLKLFWLAWLDKGVEEDAEEGVLAGEPSEERLNELVLTRIPKFDASARSDDTGT